MQQLSVETSFVVRFFEDFVTEIVRFKDLIQKQAWIITDGFDTPSAESTAKHILSSLKEFLDRQSLAAPRFGGEFAAQYYSEAQFIMVALADEVFIHTKWAGNKFWEGNILENQMFESHTAGEVFFENLNEFLKNRDPVRSDIAYLYLMALGLGFLGKYRDKDDKGQLSHYRRQLYVFINHEEPKLQEKKHPLILSAYANTLKGNAPKKLHDFRPWFVVFFIMFVIMLLASYQIWHRYTQDLFRDSSMILRLHDEVKRNQS